MRMLSLIERILVCGTRCYLALVLIIGCLFSPHIEFAARKEICDWTPWLVLVSALVVCVICVLLYALQSARDFWRARRLQRLQRPQRLWRLWRPQPARQHAQHARDGRRGSMCEVVCTCAREHFVLVAVASVVLLFLAQLIVIHGAWFYSGWDIEFITNMDIPERSYFSAYPNQLFLAGTFRILAELSRYLGVYPPYVFLLMGSSLCVCISIFLTALIAYKLMAPAHAYGVLLLAILLIGCNPWFLIPYSDTYAMPFVVIPFFVMSYCKKRFLRAFFVVFFVLIGMFIKPTVIFVGLTIGLFALQRLASGVRACGGKQARGACAGDGPAIGAPASGGVAHGVCALGARAHGALATKALVCVVAACLAGPCAYAIKARVCARITPELVSLDSNRTFGITHFLMMGTNPTSFGSFSYDDVVLSFTCETTRARTSVNLSTWKSRLADLGARGYIVLLGRKSLSNYMDGSFGWNNEGDFVKEIMGDNEYLLRWFGIKSASESTSENTSESASNSQRTLSIEPFSYLAQILWFITIFGVLACPYKQQNSHARNAWISHSTNCMMIAILMLSMFLMIFECRARYLFLYTPLFVILAMSGYAQLFSWGERVFSNVLSRKKRSSAHE